MMFGNWLGGCAGNFGGGFNGAGFGSTTLGSNATFMIFGIITQILVLALFGFGIAALWKYLSKK